MCPKCGGRAIGRVGVGQFYCWDCCIEYVEGEQGTAIFALDEEGELTPLPPASTSAADEEAAV